MRKSRRTVIPLAVFALLAAGGTAAVLSLAANAQTTITSCPSTSTTAGITCTIDDSTTDTTVNSPSTITAVVTLGSFTTTSTSSTSTSTSTISPPTDLYVQLQYQVLCFQGSNQKTTQSTSPGDEYAISSSVTENLTLGYTNPDSCEVVSLTATLEASTDGQTFNPATTGSFTMNLEWTPASGSSSSSAPPTVNVSTVKGYDSKCIDDKGNSSADKTRVIIWSCNSHDSAQGWTFSNGELKHNNRCANVQGGIGSGHKVILWSCNGASNEKWFHSSSDGEYVLSDTSHGLLCVDDPGYSKSNGTQLIVYPCHNSSNQHWTT
jgi:hypothetical protein